MSHPQIIQLHILTIFSKTNCKHYDKLHQQKNIKIKCNHAKMMGFVWNNIINFYVPDGDDGWRTH